MRTLLDEAVRALGQIIVFSALPFVVWVFAARKRQPFCPWIGLKKPVVAEPGRFVIGIAASLVVAAAMSPVLDSLWPSDVQLANARFAGQGLAALPGAVVFAFFATALPEEVLFRGFIGARLGERLGFAAGNTIQAALFGLLHGAALFGALGLWPPLAVVAFTGTLGWIMGYVNHKAGGSILPSVVLHGVANAYASALIMF
ncbi:MAG: CPBP family intramembrane metalloprotease [Bifidobacteriaceae bacterium]|jgi:membrane protease YdiL (CAAX protease family)|nr:CPBP family intramembrane metalloprotease [Bifidobacteriaceae bacterium]